MEILTVLIEICATFGFPVAVAVAMGIFIYKIYKASEKREENLMNELKASHVTNAQAIETITKFADSIGTIKDDVAEIKTDITVLKAKVNTQ